MMNDPLTHLHLHRMTVDEATARWQHRLDRLPRRRRPMQRLWAVMRRRRTPLPAATPARPIAAAADIDNDGPRRIGTTRSAPHAA